MAPRFASVINEEISQIIFSVLWTVHFGWKKHTRYIQCTTYHFDTYYLTILVYMYTKTTLRLSVGE